MCEVLLYYGKLLWLTQEIHWYGRFPLTTRLDFVMKNKQYIFKSKRFWFQYLNSTFELSGFVSSSNKRVFTKLPDGVKLLKFLRQDWFHIQKRLTLISLNLLIVVPALLL